MDPANKLQARILNKVSKAANSCWEWTGRIAKNGYAQAWHRGTNTSAHRVSYIAFKGEIPFKYTVDHLCRNIICVNPDHLEAVPHKVNAARGNPLWKQEAARTHCPYGHEYTEDNTYSYPTKHGGVCRNCKTCMKERTRRNYWARKAVA